MECRRAENLVDAYLDGELDPIHAMEVEGHLQECGKCTAILEGRKALQQALRTQLPYFTAPAQVRRQLQQAPRRGTPFSPVVMALAACLIVAIGLLAWPVIVRPRDSTATAAAASTAVLDAVETGHLRSLLTPEHLTDVASSDRHTVKPWFAGKLSFAPPVDNFAAEGFPLVGGRLDVIDHQTVAALVYRRDKHLINVFIWPAKAGEGAANVSPAVTTARGYHVVHWTSGVAGEADAGMNYWAVSDVESRELLALADLIRSKAAGAATTPTLK